jgi:hypothetical protein
MKTDGYNNLLSIELGQLHTEAPAPSRTISIMKRPRLRYHEPSPVITSRTEKNIAQAEFGALRMFTSTMMVVTAIACSLAREAGWKAYYDWLLAPVSESCTDVSALLDRDGVRCDTHVAPIVRGWRNWQTR